MVKTINSFLHWLYSVLEYTVINLPTNILHFINNFILWYVVEFSLLNFGICYAKLLDTQSIN